MAEGTITITISHYLAVFHIILLFLQVCTTLSTSQVLALAVISPYSLSAMSRLIRKAY